MNQKPNLLALSRQIWMQPRLTIRQVVDYNPQLGQREIILTLAGVSGLLALPQGIGMMLLEFGLNLILLFISIYPMAWLLWLTGKPLGGKAGFGELCAAMIWPMVPSIIGCLFALPLLNTELAGDLIQALFYLYSFHIMVQTVAEVQGFSGWRSFFNQLFALLISLLPFLLFWNQIYSILKTLMSF